MHNNIEDNDSLQGVEPYVKLNLNLEVDDDEMMNIDNINMSTTEENLACGYKEKVLNCNDFDVVKKWMIFLLNNLNSQRESIFIMVLKVQVVFKIQI